MSTAPQASASTSQVAGNFVNGSFSFKDATKEEVLEDLSSRFILNLPDEELASVERICFQVEQAHWFYEDFIREENPSLPSLQLKKFSLMLFQACPLLRGWSHEHEKAFDDFMRYKTRVPVCGAIMLNPACDKCILVKGWKASSGWGFPKGKINQDEPEHMCAIREVLEETGFDVTSRMEQNYAIRLTIKEQMITLYVVPNVPEDYPFETRTRKEISKIDWFNLRDLPTWNRHEQTTPAHMKFYLISPFVGPLKNLVKQIKAASRLGTPGSAVPLVSAPPQSPSPARKPKRGVAFQHNGPNRMEDPATDEEVIHERNHQPLTVELASTSAVNALFTANMNQLATNGKVQGSTDTLSLPVDEDAADLPVTNHLSRLLNSLAASAATGPLPNGAASTAPEKPPSPLPQIDPIHAEPMPVATPEPPVKSKFDFFSPFDALASPTSARKVPAPKPAAETSTLPRPNSAIPPRGPKNAAPISSQNSSIRPAPVSNSPVMSKRIHDNAPIARAPSPWDVLQPAKRLEHPSSVALGSNHGTPAAPSTSTPAPSSASSDVDPSRKLKHLALLETVAVEAEQIRSTPSPQLMAGIPLRHNTYPAPKSPSFLPPPPSQTPLTSQQQPYYQHNVSNNIIASHGYHSQDVFAHPPPQHYGMMTPSHSPQLRRQLPPSMSYPVYPQGQMMNYPPPSGPPPSANHLPSSNGLAGKAPRPGYPSQQSAQLLSIISNGARPAPSNSVTQPLASPGLANPTPTRLFQAQASEHFRPASLPPVNVNILPSSVHSLTATMPTNQAQPLYPGRPVLRSPNRVVNPPIRAGSIGSGAHLLSIINSPNGELAGGPTGMPTSHYINMGIGIGPSRR